MFYCALPVIFTVVYLVLFRLFTIGDDAMNFGAALVFLALVNLVLYPIYLYTKCNGRVASFNFVLSLLFLFAIRTEPAFFMGYSISFSESESNTPIINIGDMVVSRHFDLVLNRDDFVGFTAPDGIMLRKK